MVPSTCLGLCLLTNSAKPSSEYVILKPSVKYQYESDYDDTFWGFDVIDCHSKHCHAQPE